MKCCMVACINILYWGNRSAVVSGGGGRVGGFVFFTRFRPFGVDLQKKICKSSPNGLKRVKNTKPPTRPPQPAPTADAADN